MEAMAIVTALALIQMVFFALQVGKARSRHGINAPQMSGHEEFEREFRVHQNTLEQIVVFLPAMWMFGYFVHPYWGAGLGVVYVISRFFYRARYVNDPGSRGAPFVLGFLAITILLLGAIVGAVLSWMAH